MTFERCELWDDFLSSASSLSGIESSTFFLKSSRWRWRRVYKVLNSNWLSLLRSIHPLFSSTHVRGPQVAFCCSLGLFSRNLFNFFHWLMSSRPIWLLQSDSFHLTTFKSFFSSLEISRILFFFLLFNIIIISYTFNTFFLSLAMSEWERWGGSRVHSEIDTFEIVLSPLFCVFELHLNKIFRKIREREERRHRKEKT